MLARLAQAENPGQAGWAPTPEAVRSRPLEMERFGAAVASDWEGPACGILTPHSEATFCETAVRGEILVMFVSVQCCF